MNVLSLFDGISCGRIALERAGIKVDKYYASEIDKYAIQIAQKNYPDTIQLGDVKNVGYIPNIDLMIGGSPCTDLSISKKDRKGLAGEESFLFWYYVRLLELIKPKHFLFENNYRMPKQAYEIITKTLGVKPILINSALVSAQQRLRYYWTNIPGIKQPQDKRIYLENVLNYSCERRYRGAEFKQKKPDLEANIDKLYKLGHTGTKDNQSTRVYSIKGKSQTIAANAGGGGAKTGLYLINGYLRSLIPEECEQLQNIPIGYTDGIPQDTRIKCIGNGWTADVIAHIFKQIPMAISKVS